MNTNEMQAEEPRCPTHDQAEAVDSPLEVVGAMSSHYALVISTDTEGPVIQIKEDGEIIWRDKVVEGDESFKAAMLDLSASLKQITTSQSVAGSTDFEQLAKTNRDLSEALLDQLAASQAREGILRDTVRLNHEWHQEMNLTFYKGGAESAGDAAALEGIRQANVAALDMPEDDRALKVVLMNRGDIVERIRQFNLLAGNTDDRFNVRQAALYFGLQLEEMAEKLETIIGSGLEVGLVDSLAADFKQGRYDEMLANVDRTALLDDDIDQIVVTLGSLLSQGANIHGAFSEVHRSNMSKVWEDGTMRKDANGKIVKPPHYSPPDLSPYVNRLTTTSLAPVDGCQCKTDDGNPANKCSDCPR